MGDKSEPDMFMRVCQGAIEKWLAATKTNNYFSMMCDFFQDEVFDASIGAYAYDVFKLTVAPSHTRAEARSLVNTSDDILNECLAEREYE